jgi:hypothetical protein
MAVKTLLTNQTENGSGDPINSDGGHGIIIIWGEFGGAIVKPEIAHDASAEGFLPIRDTAGADISITSPVNDEMINFLPSEMKLRLTVSNASGTTDINAKYVD